MNESQSEILSAQNNMQHNTTAWFLMVAWLGVIDAKYSRARVVQPLSARPMQPSREFVIFVLQVSVTCAVTLLFHSCER